jgi:hypothetical protein
MEQKFRYLINNKVFGSSTDMPDRQNYGLTSAFEASYNHWKQSLTELACDKEQILKIRENIYYSNKEHQGYKFADFIKKTIDITSITFERCCSQRENFTLSEQRVFLNEDVIEERNNTIEFAEWILDNTSQILGSRLRSYYVGGLLHGEYTTQELYEIFKKQI